MVFAAVALICVVVVVWLILKNTKINLDKTHSIASKVLAVVLFICYAGTWYYNNAIDYVAGMDETLFSKPMLLWIIVLRWLTMTLTSLAILVPFYKSKSLKTILTYLGSIVAVLNLVLKRAEREEQAMLTTLAGLIVVLMLIIDEIGTLFETVKSVFGIW